MTENIKIFVNGREDSALLSAEGKELKFTYDNYEVTKYGEFPFLVLQEIRLELEKKNIFIVINGSRKDVYPSGLSSLGYNAYVQTFGKPTTLDDLVDILTETDKLELIGTVDEQLKYHKDWLHSIK